MQKIDGYAKTLTNLIQPGPKEGQAQSLEFPNKKQQIWTAFKEKIAKFANWFHKEIKYKVAVPMSAQETQQKISELTEKSILKPALIISGLLQKKQEGAPEENVRPEGQGPKKKL